MAPKKRILIVEDEGPVAEDLLEILSNAGYEVVAVVKSGDEAISKARRDNPDLILMDIVLEGDLDGIEAAKIIRDELDIPVVYLSAFVDRELLRRARVTHAYGYLVKPFYDLELIATIEMAVSRHELETELRLNQENLKRLKEELEQRVTERTTGLIQLNQDLEREIAERTKAEEALAQSESRFRALFEHMTNGVAIYRADNNADDFVFVDFNKAAEKISGKFWADVIGRRVTEVFPGVTALGLLDVLRKAWRDGTSIHLPAGQYKDDRIEIWVENFVYRLPTGEIVAVFSDQTEARRAELTLRDSERMLKTILGTSPVGISLSHNRKLNWCNDAWAKMFGFESEHEYVSQDTRIVFPSQEEYERVGRILYDGLETGKINEMDATFRRKDGTVFYGHIRMQALHASDETKGQIAAIADISLRKAAEEALRKSEERYRIVADFTYDWEYWLAPDGTFLYVSPSCKRITGYDPQDFMNDSSMFEKILHPDDRERVRRHLKDALGHETWPPQFFDFRIMDRQGEIHWIRHESVAVQGRDGAFLGRRASNHDITDRKRDEIEQKRLAIAVEQCVESIMITDKDGRIQYVNPSFERITGYSREEALGNTPTFLEESEDDRSFIEGMIATIKSGKSWKGRIRGKRKNGEFFHKDMTISPVRDSTGEITNYVDVGHDVGERIELERQLLHAQKMEAIGTLAGGIAHDFNNILQVTQGFSELLLAEKDEGDPERSDLLKIFHAAKHGADLVQRLLTFSRKVEPKPIPLDLNRHITNMAKLLQRTIPKMIDIQLELAGNLPDVSVDPSQLQQVLMNLAVNARDAMPDGGKLTIETRIATVDDEMCKLNVGAKPGEYVLLRVSDNGHGMDQETIDHIFEPFYTTKEVGRGTGLGLAMVYGIVKQHDGFIRCQSSLGRGATFEIFLPAIESEAQSDEKEVPNGPLQGTETVLLVDDEENVRDLGTRILNRAGYKVLTASNGKEALTLFRNRKNSISLVVLDLIMPEMGGGACLRELLKIAPQTKVLIASGQSDGSSTEELIKLGARGFAAKPFRVVEMLRLVRSILDER
jgi:PAS domain S-box-containing protein